MDRVGLLSPLEESSAEISRDSGIVSQSASSLSMVSEILSSGTVSQSPSFGGGGGGGGAANGVSRSPSLNVAAAGAGAAGAAEPGTCEEHLTEQDEEALAHAAHSYSAYIRATAGEEVLPTESLPTVVC